MLHGVQRSCSGFVPQVEELFRAHEDVVSEPRYRNEAVQSIRNNAKWLRANAPAVCAWLRQPPPREMAAAAGPAPAATPAPAPALAPVLAPGMPGLSAHLPASHRHQQWLQPHALAGPGRQRDAAMPRDRSAAGNAIVRGGAEAVDQEWMSSFRFFWGWHPQAGGGGGVADGLACVHLVQGTPQGRAHSSRGPPGLALVPRG